MKEPTEQVFWYAAYYVLFSTSLHVDQLHG